MLRSQVVLVAFLVMGPSVASEGQVVRPEAQDENEAAAESAGYDLDSALFSLGVMHECLGSFRNLTELVRDRISEAQLKQAGNTDWEMQTLGFENHPGIVEGTLRAQDLRIRRLELELARRLVEEGSLDAVSLERYRSNWESSRGSFQQFLSTFRRRD